MKFILAMSVAGLATLGVSQLRADSDNSPIVVKKPFDQHKGNTSSAPPQILWHGGNVMGTSNTSVPLYVIYYGSAFPSTTKPILDAFFSGVSSAQNVNTKGKGTAFGVNSSYCEQSTTSCPTPGSGNTSVSGALNYAGHLDMPPSAGSSINNSAVGKILQSALTTGGLPADDNAIYVVITDPTIKVTGFPNSFCAYHTHSTSIVAGHNIHYAFAPEPAKNGFCDGNFANGQSVTPNGDQGADEITDSLMHEFSETVSDPDINAWYTSNGAENGDLCNYVYGDWGSLPSASNGAKYNTTIGGQPFLVQLIWKNTPTPQACAAN